MMDDRQAAAIRRKKRDEAWQRDEDRYQAVVGNLMAFRDVDAAVKRHVVGWYHPSPDTVKGHDHICVRCALVQPEGYKPVLDHQLAATRPCTVCGVVLELLVRPEKK